MLRPGPDAGRLRARFGPSRAHGPGGRAGPALPLRAVGPINRSLWSWCPAARPVRHLSVGAYMSPRSPALTSVFAPVFIPAATHTRHKVRTIGTFDAHRADWLPPLGTPTNPRGEGEREHAHEPKSSVGTDRRHSGGDLGPDRWWLWRPGRSSQLWPEHPAESHDHHRALLPERDPRDRRQRRRRPPRHVLRLLHDDLRAHANGDPAARLLQGRLTRPGPPGRWCPTWRPGP